MADQAGEERAEVYVAVDSFSLAAASIPPTNDAGGLTLTFDARSRVVYR
jgi:hypothetical protein